MTQESSKKFDLSRANEYGVQARIGLAGYDACHELSACILSAALNSQPDARILVVGAGGTAGEIIKAAKLEPTWTFLAVDPSEPMATLAIDEVQKAGLEKRVEFITAELSEVPNEPTFDAAIVIGVLHHIPDDTGKSALLADVSSRLRSDGSLVLAGNYRPYEFEPLLMAAWAARWRMHGADTDEVEAKFAKLRKGAVPPESEEKIGQLLADAGFADPRRFFSSLFWGAWHTTKSHL